MKRLLYLLVLFPFPFAWEKAQPHPVSLRPHIERIVEAIAEENVLKSKGVGEGGTRTEQWERFEKLQNEATAQELIELTDHPNAVVKCYAFQALATRKQAVVFPVLVKHLTDTATVHTFQGCIKSSEYTGDYFLDQVTPAYAHPGNYKLTPAQQAQIDSILLYNPAIRLTAKDRLLGAMPPLPKHYRRVREIARQEKNLEAFIVLAKYQRQDDIPLLLGLFNNPDTEAHALQAVEAFPDEAFYPYLVKVFNREWKEELYDSWKWRVLYLALAQYPKPETLKLFARTTKTTDKYRYQTLGTYLTVALTKYPHELFIPLKESIHLDASHRRDVQETLNRE